MTATFKLTRADHVRLEKMINQRLFRSPGFYAKRWALRFLSWLVVGLVGVAHMTNIQRYPNLAGSLKEEAVLLIVALVVWFLEPRVAWLLTRGQMVSTGGAFLAPQTVEFSEESFSLTSAGVRTVVRWSSLLGREEDDANYYLFTDAAFAYVLPRAALAAGASDLERLTQHVKLAG